MPGYSLDYLYHTLRLGSAGAFLQFELHRLAFLKSAIAFFLDGRIMNEHVSVGAFVLDESVTLGVVEPLYFTRRSHLHSPNKD